MKIEKALVLIDVWDENESPFQTPPGWWKEATEIVEDKLVPVLIKAREEGWVIIHCHSGFKPLSKVAPISGEYEVPYDAPLHAHCPKHTLEYVSVIYFVGFALNICVLNNACGIRRTSGFLPDKELVLLEDCTKAHTANGNTEFRNFELAIKEIKKYCRISTSSEVLG